MQQRHLSDAIPMQKTITPVWVVKSKKLAYKFDFSKRIFVIHPTCPQFGGLPEGVSRCVPTKTKYARFF